MSNIFLACGEVRCCACPSAVLVALLKKLSYLLQLARQPSGLYHCDKRKDKLSLLLWSLDIAHII